MEMEITPNAQIISKNLKRYQEVEEYLGDIIRKRLNMPDSDFEHGILTQELLLIEDDFYQHDEHLLEQFNEVLKLGRKYCTDFKEIFKFDNIKDYLEFENKIADILAEVFAFVFLYSKNFTSICKLKTLQKRQKVVDFTAFKNNQNYAIEVTRLHRATSINKQAQYENSKIPMIDSKRPQNFDRVIYDIFDEIGQKYTQIYQFCEYQNTTYNGVLIVCDGREYFIGRHKAGRNYSMQPAITRQAIDSIWRLIEQSESDYKYMKMIALTMGQDKDKAIISMRQEQVS